jgi:hypothetical protein
MEIKLDVINIKHHHNIHNLKLNFKKVGKVKDFHIPRPSNFTKTLGHTHTGEYPRG